jgi:DNA-binding PadR family transcriptional regulator
MMPEAAQPLTALSLAILIALADESLHGYALMQAVRDQTAGALKPGTGTLYAALERLTDDGLIREDATPSTDKRRGRTYAISEAGRERARAEVGRLQRIVHLARQRDLAPREA